VSTLGPPGPPGPGPTGRRRALSTGTALFLIAVGAILWFAVTANAVPGLNLHIVGIILLLIGVIGLLLPMASGPRTRRSLSPWLRPSGHDDPRVDELKRAAAADDAVIEEDDKFFDPYGPGSREDDL
jgi:hypothetical protein